MDSNCFLPTFPLKIQWHNEELAFFGRDTEERRHRPRGWQSSRSIICYVLGDVTLLCVMDSPIFITLQSVSGEIRFGGVLEIWRWPCLSMRCAYIFFFHFDMCSPATEAERPFVMCNLHFYTMSYQKFNHHRLLRVTHQLSNLHRLCPVSPRKNKTVAIPILS